MIDRDTTQPPGWPSDSDRHLVAAGATGAWVGQDGKTGVWQYPGLATLFDNEGAGHQAKVNNSAVGETGSFLLQTNFSGRAEIGLTGDDNFHLKIGPDGNSFKESIVIDRNDGKVAFPESMKRAQSGNPLLGFLPTTGGVGIDPVYRIDTIKDENPRSALILSVSLDVITLTTTDAGLFFHDIQINGVVYVRIRNTSKSPEEPAWVKVSLANNQLTGTDANQQYFRLVQRRCDPDRRPVEPQAAAGHRAGYQRDADCAVWRGLPASGRFSELGASGFAALTKVDISPTGDSGTFLAVSSFTDGSMQTGQAMIPCSNKSPISNSKLVYLRETDAGADTIGIGLRASTAYWFRIHWSKLRQ